MATIAGTVKEVSNGTFHVKDENGNIKILKVGDTIYENDTVYGDSTNTSSSKIEIELSGNDVIVLSAGQEQLIDSSLIETAFGTEELFFTREGLDLNPDSYNAQENVVSDLRDAQFKNNKEDAKDENNIDNKDVTEEETAEGKEKVEDEEAVDANFQQRDGNITDVISDLRDATFRARTQIFEDKALFKNESENRLETDHSTTDYTDPFSPTTDTPNIPNIPTNSGPDIPEVIPPIPPSIPNVTLSINDVSAYESEGFLIFTVSLDRAITEDVTFNYKTSQLTATANEDYDEISGTITILQGDKTAIIKVPITDDYFADNGETLKVTISDVIGDVEVRKPEGIGTILDNSNPSNTGGEPGGYDENDSIYAIIVGPDGVKEGDTTTQYTVKLIDKDGNPVVVTQNTQVTVVYKNETTQDGDTQYNENDTISITIPAGNSQNSFTVDTIKDEQSDDKENFNLSINDVQSGEFENIILGDIDGNYKDVTTTIYDSETVFVKISNNDTTAEGGTLEHTISLYTLDENNNEIPFVIEENETITITLSYSPADTNGAIEGVDYIGETTVIFTSSDGNSKTIQNSTIDDYFNESDETYIVTITDIQQENNTYGIFIDEENSSVTGTILDNEPNETSPDEGSYGSEDTVYAIIQGPESVNEGDTTTQYTVKLIDENGNEVVVSNDTTVTVVYKNGTTQNGDTQYNEGDTISVTISQNSSSGVFTVDTIDDYLADNGENYNLTITNVQKTGEFENVAIGDKDGNFTNVTTSILDNSNPSNPGAETGGYGNEDKVYAIIQGPESVNEGDTTTQYTVKLIDENGNEVVVSNDTTVTVVYKNGTTQNGDTQYNDGDTISVTISQNSSSGVFTVDTIDDYLADNGENYNLTITNVQKTGEFENVAIGDKNGNFTNVTTTILDNSQPNTPIDLTDDTIESDKEIVVIKLFAADENGDVIKDVNGNYQLANSVDEGNAANYIAYAFEKGTSEYKDSTKLQIQAGSIDVNFNNDEAVGAAEQTKFDGTQDFKNITKTINIGESFSTDTYNDVITENSEVYNVTLDANSYVLNSGNGYESVEIDTTPVETTINDFTAKVFVKIEPVVDTTYEGDSLEYVVSLVDENGNVVTIPTGKSISVDLSYSNNGANPAEADDYTKVNSVIITGGNSEQSFTLPAIDDFYAEGDEGLKITIGNITGDTSIFENILLHTVANGASEDKITTTGTIKDNPANTEQPTDENNVDNSTGSYDEDDTVYVKITHNDSVYEGNTLTHTVTLVDKAGTPITVPAGENITVTLSYSSDTSENADYEGNTKVTQVTITSGNSSVDVENLTIDDFVANENGDNSNESYTLTITDVSQNNSTYENIAIDTNNDSVTGEIIDGVTLGVPTNAYVDEDNFDITLPNNEISDTKSLNISAPNGDNGYKLLFDSSVIAKDPDTNMPITLTSNSQNIIFDYSTEGKIIATRDGDSKKVFEITLNKNIAGGADDNYTYKQYENIDHPDTNSDDNVVLTFGYKIEDQTKTSSVQNFTVTVNDSLPSGTSQNITLDEDSSKLIVISDESFLSGDITLNNGVSGPTVVANGNSIDIYDNLTDQVKVGTLTNNGDGTLTFTPEANYSGTTAGFTYSASDNDGDTAGSTVNITVNPIADKPDMNGANTGLNEGAIKTTPQVLEDNNNDAGVESGTLYKATIGLILPQATDIVDLTNNTDNDQPEKLGLITLSSSTTETVIIDGVEHSIDSNGITIFINDIADYHYSGIDTSGAISITQAQFEAIEVKFENDNAVNPKFTISVDEYEVNDDNTLKIGVAKASNSQDYEVDILAVTDPVTLQWNDDPSNLGSFTSSTFTFDNVNEGYGTIDLKALLTNTNGLETDADGDLDGSEHRSYTITGIPEGTIITIGSKSVAADSTGTATINFPDNTADDPDFTMKISEQFSGTINGTITLNVKDTDGDSTGVINTQSASVDFNMFVNPIADPVTLKVAQAYGNEDAGRTNSNDESTNASVIDAPQDGIELYINVISDDNKDIPGASSIDAKEEYNVTIDGIPDGGSLYVYDNSSSTWKLIDETNAGTDGNLVITDNPDGTWKVLINDYQNDNLPKFIPPYNSDADYTFDISAYSYDNPNSSIAQTLQIDVTVDAVADVPVNDDLNNDTVNDDENDTNSFTLVSTEDNGGINLKAIFNTPALLDSNDGESGDGSETLTFKVTGLADGFYINGATFIGGTGTSRVWLVDKTELNNDNVTLQTPTHYAGQVDFQIQFVTTEDAGDSKTHAIKDISAMITPVTEGHIASSDVQNEDESKVLNFDFISPDTDDLDAGKESLESFSIDVTGLEAAGITLVSNGVDLTTGKTGYQTLSVTNGVVEAVTATLSEDIDTDYSFNITYTYKDVAVDNNGNTYTDTKTVTDQLYSVTVNAITDDITLVMSTTAMDANISDDAGHVTVTDNGSFTKTLIVTGIDSDGRGNADKDSSEEFTRITVSGVPEGITIPNGIYAGDTGGGNYSGFWYVDIANQALDNDGATYDLVFDVDGSFDINDLGDYQITVTAYNQEKNNDVEQSDSQSFTLTIDTTITGPGPGTPATITAFYQDIDNDLTHDHAYVVSTTADTNITDSDAYEGSVVREDTQFHLSDVLHVETDTAGATSQAFSITLKNVPIDVDIQGMTLNANGFYTLSGTGDQTAIVTKLQSILITPKSNANTDASDIDNTDLNFDVELTTYASGGASNSALINFTASVLPVTDEMDLTIVNDGVTDEDVVQTFSITLDNDADGVNTQIIDGKVYLKLTENYSDTQGTDGLNGTLSYGGSVITVTTVTGITDVPDGDYYVIENVNYNDTLDFAYTPATNRDGTIIVDTYVRNKEGESWTSYDTNTLTTYKTFSFNVDSVIDGFSLNSGATINGTEDELVPLNITLTSTDSSEKLSSVSISGLPDGFLLFYGENSDGSGKSLANNLGVDGTTTIQMTYGVDETVDVNRWNIPLNNGDLPTYIWIQTPENWSGTIPDLSIIAVDEYGNTFPETITSGTIDPIVDSLTLNATQTFGKEGEDILLNLNANVEDLDGSETITLTLVGFEDSSANFKVGGEAISSSYDFDTDTYTIEGINVNDINALSVTHESISTTITVDAKMVESNGSESSLVSDSFDISISKAVASAGDDTLLLQTGISFDGLAGIDTLIVNGQTLDSSLISNIEILDLNSGNNSISLSLNDIMDLTDNNNELKIIGDSGDNISFTSSSWTQDNSTSNGDGTTTYEYSDGGNNLKLTIDDNINTSGL